MHVGVLGHPGSWYVRELKRVGEARGHRVRRLDFPRLRAFVDSSHAAMTGDDVDLLILDALLVRTMPPGSLEQVVYRMDALARLEAGGVCVVNAPGAIECAVDKYLTTAKLAAAGLPVPATFVCEDSAAAMDAFEQLGGDVVVKPLFGSEGRGILRVGDPALALRTFRTLERIGAVLYLQRYVPHAGFDVRLLVLDGRVLGGMLRRSNGDFRTNVATGGTAEPYEPIDRDRDLALRAADAVGARFAGIDLLDDAEGTRYVIEVNAVPGWRAFQKATGIDVAAAFIGSLENEACKRQASACR